jgi:hypothetical protein
MARSGSSPGLAAALAGAAILAQLAAAAVALRADDLRVYAFGRPLAIACGVKARTGLPCPTCGLSRGVALSLHGDWARAWQFSPLGPLLVGGLAASAAALLGLALAQRFRPGAAGRVKSALGRAAVAYAGAATAIWLASWASTLAAALRVQ